MAFQIRKNNSALTLAEINNIAADFFGVENTSSYVTPKNYPSYINWSEIVGHSINKLPKGQHEWSEVIGQIAGICAIGSPDYADFESSFNVFKPFIELCLYFKSLGLIPVSVD